MTGVIVLAIVIVIVLTVFLLRSRKRPTVVEDIKCERCGLARVTTSDDKRTFYYPANSENTDSDGTVACRTLGHTWTGKFREHQS